MTEVPKDADAVVIGAGIVGCSLIYHLAFEKGWRNLVIIDKGQIPTDIGSTGHASDFIFNTGVNEYTLWSTHYSREFFGSLGNFERPGGLELAEKDDFARVEELKRKKTGDQAFGTGEMRIVSAKEAAEIHPYLDSSALECGLYDPNAGLVVPRSVQVAGNLVQKAEEAGAVQKFPGTPVTNIEIEDGRVRGVHTPKGFIRTPVVASAMGMWGPLLDDIAGVEVPLMPIEHPLLFFGPVEELKGPEHKGKYIVYPLLRVQSAAAYARDTGAFAPGGEHGMFELGYYEMHKPRLVHADNIAEEPEGRFSPSMHKIYRPEQGEDAGSMEEAALNTAEPAIEAISNVFPGFLNLGLNAKGSFNGLLSVTPDGGSLLGEFPNVHGLWSFHAVWIKEGPGVGKVGADLINGDTPPVDIHGADINRFYPVNKKPENVEGRSYEIAQKIYGVVHDREPFESGREQRYSPMYAREKEFGGFFLEAAGWERAHAYKYNEDLLNRYRHLIPERENEWDARHFSEISNAEHLEMSRDVGMVNLTHFAIYDITGPDAEALLEYLSVARVGGEKVPPGKAVYTNFLTREGGILADLTITRLSEKGYRVVCGGDTGHRDLQWISKMRDDFGFNADIEDKTHQLATIGFWGPNAQEVMGRFVEDPDQLSKGNLPFLYSKHINIGKVPAWFLNISYVRERGWEIYLPFDDSALEVWDTLLNAGVRPIGIETYALSRRVENSLRLQDVELKTHYNLYEAGLARPKVKENDFWGKAAYLEQRKRFHQDALLCTLNVDNNVDGNGVPRYFVGHGPIKRPDTGEVLVDGQGRRSYFTTVAFGPSVGKQLMMAYIPFEYAHEGQTFMAEYFGEDFPVAIEKVGYKPVYNP